MRWLAAGGALLSIVAARHPSHTSSAELVQRADSVHVSIRVFGDDIATAGVVEPYVEARFGLEDSQGRPVPLAWAGADTVRDMVTIRLRGLVKAGLAGGRVRNQVLTDRFEDQVNLVRASYGRRTATLVFTRGDGPKALP